MKILDKVWETLGLYENVPEEKGSLAPEMPIKSKKSGGSGLGLTLVKSIADAHGANLTVKSDVGKGTTIYLHFS